MHMPICLLRYASHHQIAAFRVFQGELHTKRDRVKSRLQCMEAELQYARLMAPLSCTPTVFSNSCSYSHMPCWGPATATCPAAQPQAPLQLNATLRPPAATLTALTALLLPNRHVVAPSSSGRPCVEACTQRQLPLVPVDQQPGRVAWQAPARGSWQSPLISRSLIKVLTR